MGTVLWRRVVFVFGNGPVQTPTHCVLVVSFFPSLVWPTIAGRMGPWPMLKTSKRKNASSSANCNALLFVCGYANKTTLSMVASMESGLLGKKKKREDAMCDV